VDCGCGACNVDLNVQRRVRAVVDEGAVAQCWVTESDPPRITAAPIPLAAEFLSANGATTQSG
jgi:hypothetical protein